MDLHSWTHAYSVCVYYEHFLSLSLSLFLIVFLVFIVCFPGSTCRVSLSLPFSSINVTSKEYNRHIHTLIVVSYNSPVAKGYSSSSSLVSLSLSLPRSLLSSSGAEIMSMRMIWFLFFSSLFEPSYLEMCILNLSPHVRVYG